MGNCFRSFLPMSNAATIAPWQATLTLRYDRSTDRTRLSHCAVQAPLKVQRSFYEPGSSQCQTLLLHTGGGMVAGDRLIYDIGLGPNSDVGLSTASAGKIYRSQGQWSEQIVNLRVDSGAMVSWFPQETIVFNAAQYHQTFQVDLAADAQFKGWEIIRFGRTARQEAFTHGHWRSRWEIWQAGHLIWTERQQVIGSPDLIHSPNGLGGWPVIATYLDLSQSFDPAFLTLARTAIAPLIAPSSVSVGLSLTATNGLIGRYRGDSSQQAKAIFTALRQLVH